MAKRKRARATPNDIRKALEYLSSRNLLGKLTPSLLARSSIELGKSFASVLKLLGSMLDAGQGSGPAPIAKEIAIERPNS